MLRKKIIGLVKNFKIRGSDASGSGKFGSSRSGGKRKHMGLDILVKKGEPVFAPFDMEFVRVSKPYEDDNKFVGGYWKSPDFDVKIFYMSPVTNKKYFKQGEQIGIAQDISEKYGKQMPTHIHFQMQDKKGVFHDPELYT